MLKRYGSFAFTGIALLLSSVTHSSEQLPENFSEYEWLVNGAREVINKGVEFAPVTSCFDLNRNFAGQTTSSIQKERAWEGYEGKVIPLTGIVEEVKSIPFSGDYLAFFKCTNSESFIVDFQVTIPGEMEDYAFELTPGDRRKVYVRLDDYSEMMGVSTSIDAFEIEMGNGESCFGYLNNIDRSTGNYRYDCYNAEKVSSFHVIKNNNEISYINAGIHLDEENDIGIYMIPEDSELYVMNLTSNEKRSLIFSEEENEECQIIDTNEITIDEDQVIANILDLKDELLETNNQNNINEWYINTRHFINSLSNEDYNCEQKNALRLVFFSLYFDAFNKDGLETLRELISKISQQ
jgi:hypothetical protein